MTKRQLIPFGQGFGGLYKLEGVATQNDEGFEIEFLLNGDISQLVIPELRMSSRRADELWRTTCFEFFWGPKDGSCYWEVNVSPSGDWNIYRFSDYRKNMCAAEEWKVNNFALLRDSSSSIRCQFLIQGPQRDFALAETTAALTAVIHHRRLGIDYWALSHGGEVADFHRSRDRTLEFPRLSY